MAPTYEPIASTTLGSDTASVTLGSGGTIPQTFTDLVLVIAARTTFSGQNEDNVLVRYNGDSGSNYSVTWLYGNGSAASSGRSSNQAQLSTLATVGAPTNADTFSAATLQIMSYCNTNVFKTALYSGGSINASVIRVVGLWRSTSAITSITLTPNSGNNWKSGSTFSLFGIKAA